MAKSTDVIVVGTKVFDLKTKTGSIMAFQNEVMSRAIEAENGLKKT